MELQFPKSNMICMQTLLDAQKESEQTLELKLPEGSADVGSVLGAWGQVVIRSKEWHGDSVGVSGGVMAWVLYMPEEGDEPVCLEGWLPFQCKWDLPSSGHDGQLWIDPQLRSVDARCVSSRKILVRAVVGLHVIAQKSEQCPVYAPGQVPEDLNLRKETASVMLPVESGEKSFPLDEVTELSAAKETPEKLICLQVQPELVDQKVMGSRMVFRGSLLISGLGVGADGGLWPVEFELPFSQYTELEQDHEEASNAHVAIAVTGLEVEPDSEGVHIKAGLTAQYTIFDTLTLELVTDAYSNTRMVKPETEELVLPVILERSEQRIQAKGDLPDDCDKVIYAAFYRDPVEYKGEDALRLSGKFYILYRSADGIYRAATHRWEETETLPTGKACEVALVPTGKCKAGSGSVQMELRLMQQYRAGQTRNMVTGVELGEEISPDPQRPSLILRCRGEKSLWDLAKSTGSTQERIIAANHLSEEPDSQRLLLIPVV